jgi:hypothetical protein
MRMSQIELFGVVDEGLRRSKLTLLRGHEPMDSEWYGVGEIASEAAYPYKGVTDFCRKNVTSGARFKKVSPTLHLPPPNTTS